MKKLYQVFCVMLAFLLFSFSPITLLAAQRNGSFTHGKPGSKKIALTFDDGPHPRYTKEILAVLSHFKIPATFFFIGENVAYYPETAKAVAKNGHEIGNHTYSHPHLKKTGDPQLYAEISQTQDIIERVTGQRPILFRPPEGFLSSERCASIQSNGLYSILWNVDTLDWKGTSSQEISRIVCTEIQGGDVILCHDYVGHPTTTVGALWDFIPKLLAEGYCFVTVSELLAQDGYSIPPSVSGSSSGASSGSSSGASSGCSA